MHTAVKLAAVQRLLVRQGLLLAPDFDSFRQQESIFAGLNLCMLASLFISAVIFSSVIGTPPQLFFVVLSAGAAINAADLIWMGKLKSLSSAGMVGVTWLTIALDLSVAVALASLSYRQDVQYLALMIVPIFAAAFRLSLVATILTVAVSAALIGFWVWNYFRLHAGPDINEYLEAGTLALIYGVGGIMVWTLVNHLRTKQEHLNQSLAELEKAKAKLVIEEKLAAVGRFSSAIAHEIRNPVAMISSALTTAANHPAGSAESQEMFEIAGSEAARLEKLTTDFLTYARPRPPSKQRSDVADSIAYIVDICTPYAFEAGVSIKSEGTEGLWAEVDGAQLQQALLNLARNAIEASAHGGTVVLRGLREESPQGTMMIRIEVENDSGPIPPLAVAGIFEPFFTTKAAGTGLGLAIARNFAQGHDGGLTLTRNEAGFVQFSLILPVDTRREAAHL